MLNHHLSSDPRDGLPFWQFISQLLLQTAYLSLLNGHNMFEAASVDADSLAANDTTRSVLLMRECN